MQIIKERRQNRPCKFLGNRGSEAVDEALNVDWELEEAEQKTKHSKTSRSEIPFGQVRKEG